MYFFNQLHEATNEKYYQILKGREGNIDYLILTYIVLFASQHFSMSFEFYSILPSNMCIRDWTVCHICT